MLTLLKSRIFALLATGGWVIRRLKIDDPGIVPIADHSPWREDTAFKRVFERIRKATLVDVYRLYELWQLVEQCKGLSGAMLEVGTWRGGTAGLLATRARELDMSTRLYTCDTFRGVVKASAHDRLYRGGEHSDTSRERVQALFDELELGQQQVHILEGIFPEETGAAIHGEHFRLCHIDVDTYESAKDVADWVWPRLVLGGIVVYDDYGFTGAGGVTKLVDEQRLLGDRVVIHNLNGHAVLVKVAG
jgi:O-methyltransferase